jgi:sarcosine oxidase
LEQVSFFELDQPSLLPVMLDWTGAAETGGVWRRIFYAVPNPEQRGAFKLGLHHSGQPVDPADGPFDPDPVRVTAVEDWAAERYAPHHVSAPTDTCLYTNTPDVDFVIDRVGPIVVGSPCSGHGFKFAPLVGKALAALALNEAPPISLDAFRIARFAEGSG